ncbi:hypothetical protein AAZX31_10G030100 [Glycine max]|uniref:Uncharacterized protein n=1 Tax=Glycine soja TaxID=3848 RepID=A0A445IH49_GLYSO|nr:uncharacterized protein LOC114372386 [Glycine soja]XP_040862215.1 uncharacterized protein LOC100782749 [Glycine max]KAG4981918.1 hypothetical protein JHK87_026667 [Glycine soja]KAG5002771.1 hypothetical protein JHK86_026910 [Glycine max]KAG5125952.1 hypothetical protein JHK82_026787 [Glycine max]KAG5150545.1 hypothetical protein JHK84_027017 [Glycine max]KAH1136496.1 hypothetical protein GYH30_026814 [Glycine max]
MHFPMKIQPIDSQVPSEGTRLELAKPVVKSRLKRLLERQFSGVLRNSAPEKIAGGDEPLNGSNDFEPSSACLAKMVQSFIEESHEKHSASHHRNRCNCFNRNYDDSSDEDSNSFGDSNFSSGEACETLKGLVACASVRDRSLLADTAKIVEKNKICKRKDSFCRKIVTDGLLALGYDASICKSRWEKSPSYPAGGYEYIDVMMGKERVVIDIDFRSEFEIARSTKAYKTILQNLPYIFVGTCERLQSIVALVSEAAKQSLKKKGMHVPPWRRTEYVKAKWLSPYTRTHDIKEEKKKEEEQQQLFKDNLNTAESESSGEDNTAVVEWKPPELKPKGSLSGVKVVTGLAVVFHDDNNP